MRLTLSPFTSFDSVKATVLAIGVTDLKRSASTFRQLKTAFGIDVAGRVKQEQFQAKPGQVLKLPLYQSSTKVDCLLLIGLETDTTLRYRMQRFGVHIARHARIYRDVAIAIDDAHADAVSGVVQGLGGGLYRFADYMSDAPSSSLQLRSAALLVPQKNVSTALRRAAKDAEVYSDAANVARDLVNRAPNDLTPVTFATFAEKEGKRCGLKVKSFGPKQLAKEGMRLFLAVNQGSAIEPRMLHLQHVPKKLPKGSKRVVLVGKGLTFDAGGLCLKPAKSMLGMKCDMAGAAVTLAVMLAVARLNLPLEVHGLIGATENMTGASAYRPGDVYTAYTGKSVEVINTDAEGRLVLADVLGWAVANLKPDVLVDHATLTGACMVALGPWRAGLYGNQDKLRQSYLKAAEHSGESFWNMPLDEDLRSTLKSSVADLKHTGAPYGGSISAALFLQEFVGEVPWLHLDIAGPSFLDKPHGVSPKGGTGFGVTTALEFLRAMV